MRMNKNIFAQKLREEEEEKKKNVQKSTPIADTQ